MHLIMSIKTFRRIVFSVAFEHTLKDNTLWTVGDMFGRGNDFYAVVAQSFFMYRRFVFVPREAVKFVNCHIFLWTLFYVWFISAYGAIPY